MEFAGKSGDVTISDQYGKVVKANHYEELPTESLRIDVSNFKSGVYFVNLKVDGRRQITKRLAVVNEDYQYRRL